MFAVSHNGHCAPRNRSADRQAHPHAIGLGAEDQIENPIDVLSAYSCAGIRHGDSYAAVAVQLGLQQRTRAPSAFAIDSLALAMRFNSTCCS